MATTDQPTLTTRVYEGSCHCGVTRYLLRLTLPPNRDSALSYTSTDTVKIYKCNCSTCHKMGFFHVRPITPHADFLLLAPLSPDTELGVYKCFSKQSSFYFCKTCGVRCFVYGGNPGVNEEIDLGTWKEEEAEGKSTKIWRPKEGEWLVNVGDKEIAAPSCYLSVNAVTIEPGQDGFDLKEWSEKGWVAYGDGKDRAGPFRYGQPYNSGIY